MMIRRLAPQKWTPRISHPRYTLFWMKFTLVYAGAGLPLRVGHVVEREQDPGQQLEARSG